MYAVRCVRGENLELDIFFGFVRTVSLDVNTTSVNNHEAARGGLNYWMEIIVVVEEGKRARKGATPTHVLPPPRRKNFDPHDCTVSVSSLPKGSLCVGSIGMHAVGCTGSGAPRFSSRNPTRKLSQPGVRRGRGESC